MRERQRDVFICHASEDKASVVLPLSTALQQARVTFWLDEAEIHWGDSITEKVNDGLANSRYVLVVLSPSFVMKKWPHRELHSALGIEASTGATRILPLVVGSPGERKAILEEYPLLYDKMHIIWNGQVSTVVDALLARLGRQPLSHRPPARPDRRNRAQAQRVVTYNGVDFIYVPAGPFTMGCSASDFEALCLIDEVALEREAPAHTVDLPPFLISKQPVTNRQYREFLRGSNKPVPFRDEGLSEPFNWDRSRRDYPTGLADHPVVLVTWEDAQDYCTWFGGRLPTEAEWEKAARGVEGRVWPWGNGWQKGRCNTIESELNWPSAVGAFSTRGESCFGVWDMSGNVWEWCRSLFWPYPYDSGDGREASGSGVRVIRGGAWNLDRFKARGACRGSTSQADFGFTIGFRVVLDPSKCMKRRS